MVFATGRRQDRLDEQSKTLNSDRLVTFALDVTDDASIKNAVSLIDEHTGGHGLDVLVNNAGYGHSGPAEFHSVEEWRGQFETNVFGLVAVTQAFLPKMRERGSGRIINVSSVVSRIAFQFQAAYCASKWAVEGFNDALRREVSPFGVSVVSIQPGVIRTEFQSIAFDQFSTEGTGPYRKSVDAYYKFVGKLAASGPGPDVVAKAIVKAVSKKRPKARYVVPARNLMLILMQRLLPARWFDGMISRVMGTR